MRELYRVVIDNLIMFSGEGLLFTIWIISLLVLALSKEKTKGKNALVYISFYGLAVYFCPLWYVFLMLRNDAEILYRVLWIIPMGIVVAFATVIIADKFNDKAKYTMFAVCLLVVMLSGKFIYSNEHYSKAENVYHVPDTVVKICDKIEVPGREIRACFPDEMVQYVRQYTATVFLAYGREEFMPGEAREYSDLREIVNSNVVDTEKLTEILRETSTPYLILGENKELTEAFDKYGFELITNIDGYNIYLDEEAYIGL